MVANKGIGICNSYRQVVRGLRAKKFKPHLGLPHFALLRDQYSSDLCFGNALTHQLAAKMKRLCRGVHYWKLESKVDTNGQ